MILHVVNLLSIADCAVTNGLAVVEEIAIGEALDASTSTFGHVVTLARSAAVA